MEGQILVVPNLQGGSDMPKDSEATRVHVKGNVVGNVAEHKLTEWLYEHRTQIREFVYLPSFTKGGVFPRPLYFRGERSGEVEFPALEVLEMNVSAASDWTYTRSATPRHYGWIAPGLRILRFRKDGRARLQADLLETLQQEQPALEEVWLDDEKLWSKN